LHISSFFSNHKPVSATIKTIKLPQISTFNNDMLNQEKEVNWKKAMYSNRLWTAKMASRYLS